MRARLAGTVLAAIFAGGCTDLSRELPTDLSAVVLDTVFTIGAADGAPHEVFEGIWDIEVDFSGRLAVLDLGGPVVHVYDSDGSHLGSIDEPGLEEGQLRAPSGIAWQAPGELLVWDPGSSWVSLFSAGDAGVAFVERFRAFAFGETGFCASEPRTYLSYWGPDAIVHEIGAEGVVNSFSPVPEVVGAETLGIELQEIAIEELSPSALLCTAHGVLDVSFTQSGVRLHNYDGGEVWSRDFDDLRPIVAYSDDGMGLGRGFDSERGSHLLRSVVQWGPSTVLVQHELRTDEFEDATGLESRLISLIDGSESGHTLDFPFVLAGHGSKLYMVRDDPAPGVVVVEIR